MSILPTGTLTFFMTDIENSTVLWDQFPEEMRTCVARHDELIENIVRDSFGTVVRPRGEGDSRFAVFPHAEDACRAAISIQHALASEFPGPPVEIKVRIGLHTGSADLRMGDYYGSTVNRCARIRGLGYGGQVLLSEITAGLVQDHLPEGATLLDLGAHPLRGLNRPEQIFQLTVPGQPNRFPPLKSSGIVPHNLPVSPTPFIGRQTERAGVLALLRRQDVRLVTLTGPGGIGKSRLSIETGHELLAVFPDGVFFIDLAPINSPDLVATTIARSIGIREGGGRPPEENLKDYLAEKEILLILDNFEQIVSAAPVLAGLLAAAPRVKALVTSRIPLQLRGEHEYPVHPLSLPQMQSSLPAETALASDAVKLFVQQARAARRGFELTQENTPAVVEICRRLDGLPLAIEIATARLKMLTPQMLLKRLDHSLQVLVSGPVDLPTRHQTLRNVIDWSYNLLDPQAQDLFARLAVFVGGFTLDSAENVCNPDQSFDLFTGLENLFTASLLIRVDSPSGEPRFDMLQTIRTYALDKLESSGRLPELRAAHARYFAAQSEVMGRKIYGSESVDWLKRTEEEHDNFRAALSWSLEQPAGDGVPLAVRICLWLFWFWYRYGHFHEGREWTERTLAAARVIPTSPLTALALFTAGMMAMWEGDLYIAASRAEEAVAIAEQFGDEMVLAHARMGCGIAMINQGRDREAYYQLSHAVESYDEINDPFTQFTQGTALVHLANAALGLGDYAGAIARLDQAGPIVEKFGDRWQAAFWLNNYGEVARAQGDLQTARKFYERTDASFREADALGDQARLTHTFAYLAMHRGELENAWNLFHESLTDFRTLGNRRGIAECLAGLAGVAARQAAAHPDGLQQGTMQWAARLLSAAQTQLSASGAAWWPADRVEIQHTLSLIQSTLSPDRYRQEFQTGQSMSLTAAIQFAQNPPF